MKREKKAQSAIEYLLMLTVVILSILGLMVPWGNVTLDLKDSMNTAIAGIECMAQSVCFNESGCPDSRYDYCDSGVKRTQVDLFDMYVELSWLVGVRTLDECAACGGSIPHSSIIDPSECGSQSFTEGGPRTCPVGYTMFYEPPIPFIPRSVDCEAKVPAEVSHFELRTCIPTDLL